VSIPIIEEELIELFLLCRGDYSTLTFQGSSFGVQTPTEKNFLARNGKRRGKKVGW
jgi:hypothetical protein